MTITVTAPNGATIDFPDGTDHATINGVMTQHFGGGDAPPAPDKYQKAAIDEQAALKQAGGDEGAGFTRRLAHGATLGADSTILAGLETPLEMIKRGTLSPSEGYGYAKAREDQIMGDARKNTGMLGTGAEVLGGGIAGAGLANAGITAGRFLAPNAGLLARAGASTADAAGMGAVAGGMEGNGLQERGINALKGGMTGAVLGGGLPIAGSVLGAVAAPAISNLRARINPQGFAESQIARAIHESGVAPDDLTHGLAQAQAEGQGTYTLADAMGNAGHELLGAAARGPGEARTAIVNALESRQAGQGRRVANALAEGFDAPQTAAQTEARMTTARDAAADSEYGAVRNNGGRVDVVPAINNIDRTIGTGGGQNLQVPNDSIEGALRPFRERLARVNPDDFEAVQRIRGDMADAAQSARQGGNGNRARLIGQAVRELDASMETASRGYRGANVNFRQRSQDIGAVGEGRTAAMRGRSEDTIQTFRGLRPQGQQAFRAGYADPLIEQAQSGAFGANKARPLTSDAFRDEAAVVAPMRTQAQMQRRIGREMTMFEGRNTAIGGSPTAKNLAHDAAAGIDPHVIGQVVMGNYHGAVRSLLSAGQNALSGNTPQVRKAIADILLQNGQNVSPRALRRMVENTVARIQYVQNIARNLGSGAAGGLAVMRPGQSR